MLESALQAVADVVLARVLIVPASAAALLGQPEGPFKRASSS